MRAKISHLLSDYILPVFLSVSGMFIYFILVTIVLIKLGIFGLYGYKEPVPIPWQYLLTSCLFPALWEEAFYRWAPLSIAREAGKQYVFPTIIASSLLFGWSHGYGISGVIFQGMMGIVSCLLFLKTKSYVCSVAFHCTWNIICLYFLDNLMIMELINL